MSNSLSNVVKLEGDLALVQFTWGCNSSLPKLEVLNTGKGGKVGFFRVSSFPAKVMAVVVLPKSETLGDVFLAGEMIYDAFSLLGLAEGNLAELQGLFEVWDSAKECEKACKG